MIYVSYQPTPEGSQNGPIVQVMRNPKVDVTLLSLPTAQVTEWREDYGTNYHVENGFVVPGAWSE